MLEIKKTTTIQAPRDKVWFLLSTDQGTSQWYPEFSEGTFAETDWLEGSKVIFKDHSQSGLIGKIVKRTDNKYLAIEYTGILMNGEEDYESNDAKQISGGREIYTLNEAAGRTTLDIVSDMTEEFFDAMSEKWDKALAKIKAIAES